MKLEEFDSFRLEVYLLKLPLLPFSFKYFPNVLVGRFKLSLSLDLTTSSSGSSFFLVLVFKVMFLTFFSLDSSSFSLCISISCSLSLPNNAAVVNVDRSLVFEIVVTFCCQDLSRHFNTFIFNSSLSNSLPKPMRWLTM